MNHVTTRLAHNATPPSPTRTIAPAFQRGSTVLFNSFAEFLRADQGTHPGPTYGTDRLPLQRELEETLQDLEGAALTRVFPSGISAISETLMAFVQTGDHILLCDSVYGPSAAFCLEVLSKFGVHTSFFPPDVGKNITEFLLPETRIIFLESPGSTTFEIQNIPAITAVARQHDIITMLDATWATPLFLDPFALGVDVSLHSVTKYLSGHSDVLMGSASVTRQYAETLARAYGKREIYAAPEDCQLTLRGLKTLSLRMKRHESSALAIASWLATQSQVDEVLYPALPSHPQHDLWKRDYSGAAGVFSFTLKKEPSASALAACIDNLRFFGIGYSWGGAMSLVTAGSPKRRLPSPYTGKTLIRLHIGLEDPGDLQKDLADGLSGLD